MRAALAARADATCPHCLTLFENLAVEGDECGGEVKLDTVACQDDECGKRLCNSCPQFRCFGCGLTMCLEHVGKEEDAECTCHQTDVDQFDGRDCEAHGGGTWKSWVYCRTCAAPEVMEERIEPVTDYRQITEVAA
jgi:hypothetical protein